MALFLTIQHYKLLDHGFEEKSFCTVNEWIDCDTVNASSYSSLFGLPVSGLGFLYYLVILSYALLGFRSGAPKKDGLRLCFYLSAGALVFSFYMAYLLLFKLKILCLLCLGMDIAVLLIFILLPPAIGMGWRDILKGRLPQSIMKHLGFVAVIYFLGIFVFFNVGKAMGGDVKPVDRERFLKIFFAQMPTPVEAGSRPMWGTPGAPVTILEFSDFQCPFCRVAAFNIKPNLAEYRNDVAFYYVNYPLDISCNKYMTRAMHPNSCLAAKASLCADREGKFWAYHDLTFKNQKTISRDTLLGQAESLGMNREAFSQCIDSAGIDATVKEDIELGNKLDVHGTPAVFVNGRELRAWRDREILRKVIAEELKRKEK